MPGTATISVRTTVETKRKAEKIFKKLGLNTTDAINIFYKMVILNQGMPFDVNIPNAETLKALRDIEEDRDLVRCEDADEMFEKLGI